jgi:uncharacterized damage-inducible protein DinB
MGSFDVLLDDERTQLDAFVEEYRSGLEAALDRLTEEQARRRLVYLQVLRELAHHCEHADILRGQVLAG